MAVTVILPRSLVSLIPGTERRCSVDAATVAEARAIVAEEVRRFVVRRRGDELAPVIRAIRRRGEEILRTLPRRPDWLQLATRSDDQLRADLSHSPLSPEDREALISAVRSRFAEPKVTTAGASRGW